MSAHAEQSDHGFSHPMPVWILIAVFFALVMLTLITVAQASIATGDFEIWISLAIATVKASLVIYFFMHLGWDKPFNAIVFLSSLAFLTLFLGFTLMDSQAYRERLEPEIDEVVAVQSETAPAAAALPGTEPAPGT